ncbi:ATP-binding domain containing protein, putative [Entamoeba invadens IP1]|uniref:ATP-binding domain containing protein, putative n=1 Tax=Entamoeba invadens IP1 TaxID=370355 RepID=UPI0002C3FBB7|nr:ATP-binding domain containing protein, putative [Entamoeba invadens IP1]ELP93420.1 ATP-binding domain containing protein, putative [Entamoeba invadens IP1]|eukprot:XP_004260191.1 ATP-binding domain containing protein, putative [Entamoeba invadens IP1]
MVKCSKCQVNPVCTKTPEGELVCKTCFIERVETIVYDCIKSFNLIRPTDHITIGVSGGKDSTALATMLTRIEKQHPTGAKYTLVAVDEGIVGYRDRSLECVHWLEEYLQLPLKIISYKTEYGMTMDEIVSKGGRNACSYCGVLRRQCLEKATSEVGGNVIATGHNGDDVAETVLMNFLRGDAVRLERCKSLLREEVGDIVRIKPFSLLTQKEVVLYAHYMKLKYFSVECSYAGTAFRGNARTFLQETQIKFPWIVRSCVISNEQASVKIKDKQQVKLKVCKLCGMKTSSDVCQACKMLAELRKGAPKIELTK